MALEREPDEGLVLFHQYLQSDPARWEDWKAASAEPWTTLDRTLSPRTSISALMIHCNAEPTSS